MHNMNHQQNLIYLQMKKELRKTSIFKDYSLKLESIMKWNNKLYASLFLAGMMAACSNAPKDAYTLEGKVTNPKLEGRTVYIIDAEKGDTRYDSAQVTNGTFQFSGKQDEAVVRELLVQENDSDMFPVTLPFVLENGLIKVELGERVYVTNTDLNEEMMNFLMEKDKFMDQDFGKDATADGIRTKFAEFITQQVMKHGNSVVGKYIFNTYKSKLTEEQQAECSKLVK